MQHVLEYAADKTKIGTKFNVIQDLNSEFFTFICICTMVNILK